MEELDSVNEWFFNESTQLLYLFYNGTGAPPEKTEYVVTNLKVCVYNPLMTACGGPWFDLSMWLPWQVLLNITATQSAPAQGITLSGVGVRDTAYTYLV